MDGEFVFRNELAALFMLRPHHRHGITVVEMLVILAVLAFLVAVMLSGHASQRAVGYLVAKELRSISDSVVGFEEKTLLSTPRDDLSWQVVVAPKLGRYGYGEHESGPRQLADQPDQFRVCGPVRENEPEVCMVIRGVAATDAFWSREDLGATIPDGARTTIMLVAIRDDGHAWYEPFDPTPDDLYREPYFGDPATCKGLRVAFADGSYEWLPPTLTKVELLELISTHGDPVESARIVDSLSASR